MLSDSIDQRYRPPPILFYLYPSLSLPLPLSPRFCQSLCVYAFHISHAAFHIGIGLISESKNRQCSFFKISKNDDWTLTTRSGGKHSPASRNHLILLIQTSWDSIVREPLPRQKTGGDPPHPWRRFTHLSLPLTACWMGRSLTNISTACLRNSLRYFKDKTVYLSKRAHLYFVLNLYVRHTHVIRCTNCYFQGDKKLQLYIRIYIFAEYFLQVSPVAIFTF